MDRPDLDRVLEAAGAQFEASVAAEEDAAADDLALSLLQGTDLSVLLCRLAERNLGAEHLTDEDGQVKGFLVEGGATALALRFGGGAAADGLPPTTAMARKKRPSRIDRKGSMSASISWR